MYTGRVRFGINARCIIRNTIDRRTINRGGLLCVTYTLYERYSKEKAVNRLCIGTVDFVPI